MGHRKSSSKGEVYSDKSPPQETIKISNKQPYLIPKGIRKRRMTKTKSLYKGRSHKYQSRNK